MSYKPAWLRQKIERQRREREAMGIEKKSRTTKADRIRDALLGQINEVRNRVLHTLDHTTLFTHEDFEELFMPAEVRHALRAASPYVIRGNRGNGISASVDGIGLSVYMFEKDRTTPLLPREPVFQYESDKARLFIEWVNHKKEFMVGFARAKELVKKLVEEFDPAQAVFLLPSLEALASGTDYASEFKPARISRVPSLQPFWRECCAKVGMTLAQAELVAAVPDTIRETYVTIEGFKSVDWKAHEPGEAFRLEYMVPSA